MPLHGKTDSTGRSSIIWPSSSMCPAQQLPAGAFVLRKAVSESLWRVTPIDGVRGQVCWWGGRALGAGHAVLCVKGSGVVGSESWS